MPRIPLLAWLAMAGRGLVLAMVLALVCTAPANAGVVTAKELAGAGFLDYEDPAGVPDDLRISASGEPTILVLGATVLASPALAESSCPLCSTTVSVMASTPAAPRFFLTRLHASHSTSRLEIRSNNA